MTETKTPDAIEQVEVILTESVSKLETEINSFNTAREEMIANHAEALAELKAKQNEELKDLSESDTIKSINQLRSSAVSAASFLRDMTGSHVGVDIPNIPTFKRAKSESGNVPVTEKIIEFLSIEGNEGSTAAAIATAIAHEFPEGLAMGDIKNRVQSSLSYGKDKTFRLEKIDGYHNEWHLKDNS